MEGIGTIYRPAPLRPVPRGKLYILITRIVEITLEYYITFIYEIINYMYVLLLQHIKKIFLICFNFIFYKYFITINNLSGAFAMNNELLPKTFPCSENEKKT